MIREKHKNSGYTHDMDNYNTYIRNKKKDLKIAKVSPFVMDEFEDLKKKCKAIVDNKLAECEEYGLSVAEFAHTIEEQESVIKAFRDKSLWLKTSDDGDFDSGGVEVITYRKLGNLRVFRLLFLQFCVII